MKNVKIIKGKYGEAKIFASIIDDITINQVNNLMSEEFVKDSKVRIMPDCHAGIGCVIGTTMTITDKVVPNLVGVDIGCGMLTINLGKKPFSLKDLDEYIHRNIPSGFDVGIDIHPEGKKLVEKLKCFPHLEDYSHLYRSVGSLGGGNHFIEIDRSSSGDNYLVIHTGSRNLGHQVATYYQRRAEIRLAGLDNMEEDIKNVIREYKQQGMQRELDRKIKEIKANYKHVKRNDFAYLEGNDLKDYLHDMDISQKFASLNRREIAKIILNHLNYKREDLDHFETIHNYINMDDMILRKGAISAKLNERVIIPINMRDGCILAVGKGNPDYNYSAPHGAGRILSRNNAFKKISLDDFLYEMDGIYTTTAVRRTLDEAPQAYKSIENIINDIKDSVEIIEVIKPIYNFKATR